MDDENDKIDSSEIAGRLRMTVGSPQYAKREIIIPNRNKSEEVVVTEMADPNITEPIVQEALEAPAITTQPEPVPMQQTALSQPKQPTGQTEDLHEMFGIERELPSGRPNGHKKGLISKIFRK
jgi:hypothetical protein